MEINSNTILVGLLSVLGAVVSFFLIRTLNKIDANQTELFKRIIAIETTLASLRAEHDIIVCDFKRNLERREADK